MPLVGLEKLYCCRWCALLQKALSLLWDDFPDLSELFQCVCIVVEETVSSGFF